MRDMHRRTAIGGLAAAFLAACGGGGGGGDAGSTLAGTAPAPSAAAFTGSRNIAAWGDSHTGGLPDNGSVPGYAAMLRQISGRTVFDGGLAGQTSTQIADRQVADDSRDDWINVFWYGGNNQSEPARIKADIARSVAALAPGNRRFIVLSVVNQASPWERRGSAGYQTIVDLNRDLAQLYPDNYIDIRSYLVGLYDAGIATDVSDRQDDVPPTSLRADGVHLNARGAMAVAQRVLAFIAEKGW
jgi:lysophospholipase L1-like esterase